MEDLPKRKRKISKRVLDSDHEEPYGPAKISRLDSTRPRRKNNDADFIDPGHWEDKDVDIQEEGDSAAALSKHSAKTSKPSKPSKTRRKSHPDGGPPARKKARNVVVSDSEEDDYVEADAVSEEDDRDDDYQSTEDQKSKGRFKASGSKRKAKGDPVASARSASEQKPSIEPIPTIKKIKLSLKVHEPPTSGAGASSADPSSATAKGSPSTLKPDSPAPQLKKIKLPTIRKINKPAGTTGTSTPISATPAPKPKLALEIDIGTKQADFRKSQTSTFDLDLSNKSVYQELFKTSTDGGTPRTSLNRRSKEEERRKELNILKEEYMVKRAAEEAHPFDLQAQHEKIARFENNLRSIRSTALYPNYLAAKWKELYERDKRKQKEQMEFNESGLANGREEGEVK